MPGLLRAAEIHLTDRQQGVDERGHEQADGELTGSIPQQALHDPRGELSHRQLHDDENDGQHERRETDHRGRHRLQDG